MLRAGVPHTSGRSIGPAGDRGCDGRDDIARRQGPCGGCRDNGADGRPHIHRPGRQVCRRHGHGDIRAGRGQGEREVRFHVHGRPDRRDRFHGGGAVPCRMVPFAPGIRMFHVGYRRAHPGRAVRRRLRFRDSDRSSARGGQGLRQHPRTSQGDRDNGPGAAIRPRSHALRACRPRSRPVWT
jgi:hypothetical protein